MIEIVLVEPEIPQNTGNIARTCTAAGSRLHLVKPLGFSLSDRYLKRAGLDYWQFLDLKIWDSFDELIKAKKNYSFYYATTKAPNIYSDIEYPENCFVVFGKETKGLSEELLKNNIDNCIRIPMGSNIRSLNLSNSAAIIAYEYLRQHGFKDLKSTSDYLRNKAKQ